MLAEEVEIVDTLAKADPRFVEALAKRGITDLTLVQLDPFGVGNRADLDLAGRRLWAGVTYFRHFEDDNAYAHIVEGVIVLVDTVKREVVAVEDAGVRPMPMTCGNYTAEHNQPMRTDVAPLEITQPNGPGFVLDGPQMTWQKWRFRIGMHPIDGLVLTGIEYRDGEDYRSIIHRAAVGEMIVPYGIPAGEPLLPQRLRRRRVRARPDGQLARAGLRLPRRHHLHRRRHGRRRRQPDHDRERDLHPRGGRRHPLEAHRLGDRQGRRASLAQARRQLHRDGRQLPLRLLLELLPGRPHRGRHQAHGHRADDRLRG